MSLSFHSAYEIAGRLVAARIPEGAGLIARRRGGLSVRGVEVASTHPPRRRRALRVTVPRMNFTQAYLY